MSAQKTDPKTKGKADEAAPTSHSALDAAAIVLKKAKGPLNTKTMVERMIKAKLWETKGKTPHATLYSAILREIKVKGKDARFKKAERGKFALTK